MLDEFRGQSESLHVALLEGGDSAERDVSLASGRAVERALALRGHRVTRIDPREIDLFNFPWHEAQIDSCFIALHGGDGENGRIQLQLEELGISYTGSSPVACRLAMSKVAAKERFAQFDIPTPDWRCVRSGDPVAEVIPKLAPIGYPVVLKPDGQGSSLGVCAVQGPDDLASAVSVCQQFGAFVLAEQFISGRELTVAVLDGEPLPVLEICHDNALFDYHTKRTLEPTAVYPLDRYDPIGQEAANLAKSAGEALGTRGLIRVDLMVDVNDRPWVLEVNAVPGMTRQSLAPRAARLAGLEMADLCDVMTRRAVATEMAV